MLNIKISNIDILRFVAHTESITISVWNQRKVHKRRGAGFLGAVKVLPTAIERLKDKGCK